MKENLCAASVSKKAMELVAALKLFIPEKYSLLRYEKKKVIRRSKERPTHVTMEAPSDNQVYFLKNTVELSLK